MTDHFAVLEQPRRPWLDADALKDVFHQQSAQLHPDVPGTGDAVRFAALNAAYAVLREPASRLRHLLELVAPSATSSATPPDLADWFMQLADLRRRLDELKARWDAASSPLSRALLAADRATLRREVEAVQARLEAGEAAAFEEIKKIDVAWGASEPSVALLLPLAHRLAYLARWLAQTREALFAFGD